MSAEQLAVDIASARSRLLLRNKTAATVGTTIWTEAMARGVQERAVGFAGSS